MSTPEWGKNDKTHSAKPSILIQFFSIDNIFIAYIGTIGREISIVGAQGILWSVPKHIVTIMITMKEKDM